MSYTALYRKFRPTTFEEVKGQDHIVTTLKNQIKAERIGHAYLFTGTRGTGKTSVAKVFAKAVNCEHPIDGSPCNECPTCRSIASLASMNVIEIDAASNNGVDNIRQIREEVQYHPTEGKYKVYIIDEVHMLSIGAFNALLKTLEEPPEYVIFILATTEVHKIPITILSRCQRYDFKRISIEQISNQLSDLMAKEQIEAEPKALRYIAKMADGSMRDALSLLDQCIAFYLGQKVTYENVLEVLGAVDTEVFGRLFGSIMQKDVTSSIHIIEELVMSGRELGQFVIDMTWYLRNLLLVKNGDDEIEDFIDASAERVEEMKEESRSVSEVELIRYIRIFSELSNQMKYSTSKRILLEIAVIKMTKPAMEQNLSSLMQRMQDLEKKIENGLVINPNSHYNDNVEKNPEPVQKTVQKKPLQAAVPKDVQYVVEHWAQMDGLIEERIGHLVRRAFQKARFSVDGENTLLAVFSDKMLYEAVNTEKNIGIMSTIIGETTGKEINFRVMYLENQADFADKYTEVTKRIHMDIKEEDF